MVPERAGAWQVTRHRWPSQTCSVFTMHESDVCDWQTAEIVLDAIGRAGESVQKILRGVACHWRIQGSTAQDCLREPNGRGRSLRWPAALVIGMAARLSIYRRANERGAPNRAGTGATGPWTVEAVGKLDWKRGSLKVVQALVLVAL